MSRLSDIAVRIETPVNTGGLGGGVDAVLSELIGKLESVAAGGQSAMIDLRSLPMSDHDRTELQTVLGNGEVQATLSTGGLSTLRETGLAGVWWVEHRDPQGILLAELIEIAVIPEILEASLEEIAASARALRSRSASNRAPAAGMMHAILS